MMGGCRPFHLDNVPVRLVTTYSGEGTQRVWGNYAAEAKDRHHIYEGAVEVGLFRGLQSTGVRILHRSPPQLDVALSHLVAVIDAAQT